MEERIDYTVKWYLRIVAGTYLLMFIPITLEVLIRAYNSALPFTLSWLTEPLYEWYFLMPFFRGLLDISPFRTQWIYIDFEYSFIPYIFWSFWLGTLIRWNLTGKHFWQ